MQGKTKSLTETFIDVSTKREDIFMLSSHYREPAGASGPIRIRGPGWDDMELDCAVNQRLSNGRQVE